VTGLAAEGKAAVYRLGGPERAAAVAITLRSGDTAWFWKIAYDEALARLSPGVLLSAAITEALLADRTILRTDSCATADHPMIGHIWRERLALSDRLIAVRPGARVAFATACRLERVRRAAEHLARRLKSRLRGR
jgi:hypothetical protein